MLDRNLLNYDYNVPYAKTLSALYMVATGHVAKRIKRFANKAWAFSRYMEMVRLVKELRLVQASADKLVDTVYD